MKMILTLGAPGAGHDGVFAVLRNSGVASARPSVRDGHTPESLSQSLLQALEIDSATAFPREQLRPGKAWQELAANVALANVEQPVWGWADHRLGWLLDFWGELGPQVRLLMVYTTPAQHLAHQCQGRRDLSPGDIEAVLHQWYEWNAALLRYHLRNQQRTLLVNGQAALAQPTILLRVLEQTWDLTGLLATDEAQHEVKHTHAIFASAARCVIPRDHKVWDLEHELHSAAALPSAADDSAVTDGLTTWAATHDLHSELAAHTQALREEVHALREQNQELVFEARQIRENLNHSVEEHQQTKQRADTLQQRCHQLLAEIQNQAEQISEARTRRAAEEVAFRDARVDWASERDSLLKERDSIAGQQQPADSGAALNDLEQENELLLLQLHQVEEELDRYFKKCQELQQGQYFSAARFAADFWKTHQPEVLVLDLRRPIVGDNWHDAESDGRWTGPGTTSTLDFPPLQTGTYMLEMDVVDAVAPGILDAARIDFQGHDFELNVEYLGGEGVFPAICGATLRVDDSAAQAPVQLALRLPRTASPSDNGSDDRRQLGVRVQQWRLIRQAA